VQKAVTRSASLHFAHRPVTWLPDHHFVRSHRYLKHTDLRDVADVALHLRNDRLPSAPSPWLYHPCSFCQRPAALSGSHLLACPRLPPLLAAQRAPLCLRAHAPLSLPEFASTVLACDPNVTDPTWLRRDLEFGRRVSRAAVRALDPPASSASSTQSSRAVAGEFEAAFANDDLSASGSDPLSEPSDAASTDSAF